MASPFWKGLFFIKGRIESVEILGVQPVGEDAQALAEAGKLSESLYPLGRLDFRNF